MRRFLRNTLTIQLVMKALLVIGFLSIILLYSLFQAQHLIDGPQIFLQKPVEITQTNQHITIEGSTENITKLVLNGREIHTDESGLFREPLVLENGYTIMTLTAEDRYGRTTSVSKAFVYQPSSIN